MKRVIALMLFIMTLHCLAGYGQSDSAKNGVSRLTAFTENQVTEKLYLQFDKPYYAVGDTIWFKAYLLSNFLLPSAKSGILNVDITNDSDKVVKQFRFPVQSGLTWGNITLSDKDFKPGTYTLRAYTNWMRNFGGDGFFYKTLTVTSADNSQLLVNAAFGTKTVIGIPSVETKLSFSTMAGLPFAAQPVILQVMNNGKSLYRQKYVTGADGSLDVNFNPPQKPDHLAIVAENDKKERLAVIPVPKNQPQNADIQFLPEGGQLVAGLPAHFGFKAIGEDGKGLDISGVIYDHSQKQVAAFKSLHNGMGCFDLDVNAGENYNAQVTLPGGTVRSYTLPPVKSSGTILTIKNELKSDSIQVTIAASKDIAASGQSFFLVGRARGIVCYGAIVNFHESNSVSKKIAKALFPTGIAHFTLMTAAYQPVNERLVFIDHSDQLKIKLSTAKPYYDKRDSVGLKLKVTDQDGNPVSGNFSMAVTDDAQVKLDSLNEENINTHLLFTADLKGYIEQPGYYLANQTPEKWQALDNLLLTQGWVGYDWAQVFNPPAITFKPEKEFAVTGKVFNVLNKPVKGTHVLLFSRLPSMLMDTVTGQDGKFIFDRFPKIDTPVFILKAVNKNGKSFNVGISVDETILPVFTKPLAPAISPWNVNIDSLLINYTKNAALAQKQQNFSASGHLLKEVKITGRKLIKDSQNLNGPGNADFVMDEKDLEAEGNKTWLHVLEERIGGFKEGYLRQKVAVWTFIQDIKDSPDPRAQVSGSGVFHWYFIHDKPIKIYVDGISITEEHPATGPPADAPYINMRDFLNSANAEDIKGIELSFSDKYSGTYLAHLGGGNMEINMDDIAFIEVTTRSGHGPMIDNTPGMFLYKPLALSWPKAFYKPKYTVKDTAKNQVDFRSTIDWEPDIVTDAKGEATVWFYTADKPSTYTITVEGTDMNGRFGYKLGRIKVEAAGQK
jgi:hypothetical protein